MFLWRSLPRSSFATSRILISSRTALYFKSCRPATIPLAWSRRARFYSAESSTAPLPPTLLNSNLQRTLSQKSARYNTLLQSLNSSTALPSDVLVSTSKELSELEDTHRAYADWLKARGDLAELSQLLHASRDEIAAESDMLDLAQEEYAELMERIGRLERDIIAALLPKDEADEGAAILEVRAGAGGDESALFVVDVMKMYERFAQLVGWKWEVMQKSEDNNKGIKDATVNIAGKGVFGMLKYESGVHRVQRVPTTETQGRIHTSTVTVAILPQPSEVNVQINDSDLRVDVYRSSGPGGQHVNTTESAVRITHLPTGIVVAMQDERSQHKNKAKALGLLRAKVYELEREKAVVERRDSRNKQIGSGDRSEKIRTYNFPQNRVTDHRINLTLHELDLVLNGQSLGNIIDQLKFHYDTQALSELE